MIMKTIFNATYEESLQLYDKVNHGLDSDERKSWENILKMGRSHGL